MQTSGSISEASSAFGFEVSPLFVHPIVKEETTPDCVALALILEAIMGGLFV